jgi:hypothetical protein
MKLEGESISTMASPALAQLGLLKKVAKFFSQRRALRVGRCEVTLLGVK